VSRPVVRQALDRLREDQLVESLRGSGTYVKEKAGLAPAPPDGEPETRIGHIMNGLELRLVLEPECAYMAALRRNKQDLEQMDACCWASKKPTGWAPSPIITTSASMKPLPRPPATSVSCR
jgi:DNA-binding FadR family transcriptional regulator